MKKINFILALIILSVCSLMIAAQTSNRSGNNAAINRSVQNYTRGHSAGVGKVRITSSDVQGDWALIRAESVRKKLDPAQYLLHRERGSWKVLVMGTALYGTGKQYKVPAYLRRKWKL